MIDLDQRVVKTKQALTQALFELLKTTPLSKITVTALCQTAGVNRRTFYIHYSRVSDIFDDYQFELSQQVEQALSTPHPDVDTLITTFNRILMANYNALRYLCLSEQHQSLINHLKQMLFDTMCLSLLTAGNNTPENQLTLQFIANGIVNAYVYWFSHEETIGFDALIATNKRLLHTNLPLLNPQKNSD